MISETFLEDLRLELKTYIQDTFSYDPGGGEVQEFKVINEFSDTPESYPCIVIDGGLGTSSFRHVGAAQADLVHFDFVILTTKPTLDSHIVTCQDAVVRSGRSLAEYGALRLGRAMKRFVPSFSFLDDAVGVESNLDMEERIGVYKAAVMYEIAK